MIRILAALFLTLLAPAYSQAQVKPHDLVDARLVAEPAAIEQGKPFTLAIRMRMKPGWHVYWRNPGDSGMPPEMAWRLPAGFSAGAIEWPAPRRMPVQHLMNFGFDGTVVLLVPITPPATLTGPKATLAGRLSYLVCEEICIPGASELSLTLPVAKPGTSVGPDPAQATTFTEARAALPQPAPWPFRASGEGETIRLDVEASGLQTDAISAAAFFPYADGVIENAAPQTLSVDAKGLHLVLKAADPAAAKPSELPGVLTFDETTGEGSVRRAYALGTPPPLAPVTPDVDAPAAAPSAMAEEAPTLWSAVGFALLGGLLLNLMPCVFPVLSIKVLGLVKQVGESATRIRLHGLAYTAGVLASFLALAGLLIALKAGGAGIGWGFQLQSPLVVAGLAFLLFAMGLSLSGVVHLGAGIAGIGDGLTRRPGLQGSFFTGVLATIVATPCTAPFMGAAVGFALTQSTLVGLAVFTSLGLGLALPFLVLTVFPGALRVLPRPGTWMDTLKGLLAFPVYATVAWLIWVLAQQVGSEGLLAALAGLVLVGFVAWAWERSRLSGSILGRAAALAALVALIGVVVVLDRDRSPAAGARNQFAQAFTVARLEALRDEGREIFVDMTAAWCITCQVNKRTTLRSASVLAAFADRNVAFLEGDWTNQNPEITTFLERHGRSGVPLYLLYKGRADPVILPQILTPDIVLTELEKLGPRPPARTGERSAATLP